MAHENCAIFASLNCMHCSTLWMTFTQEGFLTIAVLKPLSHYTFRCVRIHMELPIIMTMTNKSSTTLTYKIVYQCAMHMRTTERERERERERIKESKPFCVCCKM